MEHTPATLAELFQARIEGDGGRDRPVGDIVSDSRLVATSGGFIALPGDHDDGHRHVVESAERGAALAIVRQGWPREEGSPPLLLRVDDTAAALRRAASRRLADLGCTVVAVTGSVGKTTVKEMCAHVLADHRVATTTGNLNTWTGVPLSILRAAPPVETFVAELAMSAPGEISDLAQLVRPRIAAVLNVGLAHVGLLGSVEAIADAKAELLEALPEDGVAILNADDPRVAAMAERVAPRSVVWFGLGTGGDSSSSVGGRGGFRARDLRPQGLEGSEFTLHGPGGAVTIRLPIPGEHAVRNACAVAAIAAQRGVSLEEVADRLATFRVPDHRGRVLPTREGTVVYDDSYNSSPTSVVAALEVLRRTGATHRLAVLGDMLELGAAAAEEHRIAGGLVAGAATALIAVGEHGLLMRDAAVEVGMPSECVAVAADANEAARLAEEWVVAHAERGTRHVSGQDRAEPQAEPRSVVLVKGSRGIGLERVVEELLR